MVEPDYYAINGLSPLKAFEQGLLSKEEYIGFLRGNVIKYTIRAGKKDNDPLMDIFKAIDYLHYLHKALKTESDESNMNIDVTVNGVDELESKLQEVKDKIEDFKKSIDVRYDEDMPFGGVLTYNGEDLPPFKADFPSCEMETPIEMNTLGSKTPLRPKKTRKSPKVEVTENKSMWSKFSDYIKENLG